jgi:hypothetical protein
MLARARRRRSCPPPSERPGSGRIELLYFDGCPNYETVLPRVREIVADTCVCAEVALRRVTDDDAARRERFLRSPTVRVDGRDAERRTDYGVKCRLYRTAAGLSGRPAEERLRAALARATDDAEAR